MREVFFEVRGSQKSKKTMTMMMKFAFIFLVLSSSFASAWLPGSWPRNNRLQSTRLDMAAVGIFFGTSTGNTQDVADKIYEAFGDEYAAEPVDIETLEDVALAFKEHNALVVGTPTWNTGADTERSGTGWDELYYRKLPELKSDLQGKKVAVFGLGDQLSYSENYADATGELFDVFEGLGCQMLGAWSQEGYEHEDSKTIRGDKFCGLLLDMVNQEELTDERVEQWVAQLRDEGILEGASAPVEKTEVAPAHAPAPVVEATPSATESRLAELQSENERMNKQLEEGSKLLDKESASYDIGNFTPHYNPVTGKTMWTSPDGRKSYITIEKTTALSPKNERLA